MNSSALIGDVDAWSPGRASTSMASTRVGDDCPLISDVVYVAPAAVTVSTVPLMASCVAGVACSLAAAEESIGPAAVDGRCSLASIIFSSLDEIKV